MRDTAFETFKLFTKNDPTFGWRIDNDPGFAKDVFLAWNASIERGRSSEVVDWSASVPTTKGEAIDLRIVELVDPGVDPTGYGSILKPNAMFINGQRVLSPKDSTVTIHGADPSMTNAVSATFTVFCRSLTVSAEEKPS